jgi:hypothetical protein
MKYILGLLFSVIFAGSAMATDCPALPGLITSPCIVVADGNYLLGDNIDGSGLGQESPSIGTQIPAIKINPGVTSFTLNCNGYRITNDAGYTNRGIGIGGYQVANVVISDCPIFGIGMLYAVLIDNSAQYAYAHVTVQNSSLSGTIRGALIRSNYTTLSGNTFFNVGGQRIWSDGFSIAGEVYGDHAVMTNNYVGRVWNYYYTENVGLACSYLCTNAVISGNTIRNDFKMANSWALWMGGGSFTVTGNHIENWDKGYTGTSVSSGSASGNTATNVNTPYIGIAPPGWNGP